jgi:hypothetical protein
MRSQSGEQAEKRERSLPAPRGSLKRTLPRTTLVESASNRLYTQPRVSSLYEPRCLHIDVEYDCQEGYDAAHHFRQTYSQCVVSGSKIRFTILHVDRNIESKVSALISTRIGPT